MLALRVICGSSSSLLKGKTLTIPYKLTRDELEEGPLANERRLMILCKLVEWGEANVGSLAEAVGLSSSALSQHLAKMRDEGIVDFRRESQTLWYRIADPRTEALLGHLQQLYCLPPLAGRKKT